MAKIFLPMSNKDNVSPTRIFECILHLYCTNNHYIVSNFQNVSKYIGMNTYDMMKKLFISNRSKSPETSIMKMLNSSETHPNTNSIDAGKNIRRYAEVSATLT